MLAKATEDKEQNNPSDVKSEEMIEALVKLCKLIDSFTENPALKNAQRLKRKKSRKAKKIKPGLIETCWHCEIEREHS